MSAIERVVRVPVGAKPEDHRAFAQQLVSALDHLGVQPGQPFLVAADASDPKELEDPGQNRLGGFAGGSSTSRQAALDNYPRSGTQRERILRFLIAAGARGATSDEVADRTGMHLPSVKPRMLELRRGGWLRIEGSRPSAVGSAVDVHVATDKAIAWGNP